MDLSMLGHRFDYQKADSTIEELHKISSSVLAAATHKIKAIEKIKLTLTTKYIVYSNYVKESSGPIYFKIL